MFGFQKPQRRKSGKLGWWMVAIIAGLGLFLILGQSLYNPANNITSAPASTAVPTVPTDDSATQSSPTAQAADSFLPDYDSTLDPTVNAENNERPFWQIGADMGLKLLLVIGLVYATLAGLKWLQKGKNTSGTGGATIQVLETVGLAPGRTLHLVVVGEKTLLIGATEQQVGLITELADAHVPLPEEDPATQVQEQSAFETALQQQATSTPIEEPPAVPTTPVEWQTTLSNMYTEMERIRQTVGGSQP